MERWTAGGRSGLVGSGPVWHRGSSAAGFCPCGVALQLPQARAAWESWLLRPQLHRCGLSNTIYSQVRMLPASPNLPEQGDTLQVLGKRKQRIELQLHSLQRASLLPRAVPIAERALCSSPSPFPSSYLRVLGGSPSAKHPTRAAGDRCQAGLAKRR